MLRCRGRGAPVLLQGRPPSLAPRVPARCRATHKDLPDPPKKGTDEKVEQNLKQGKVDPETLRRLAKSITPEEVRSHRVDRAPPLAAHYSHSHCITRKLFHRCVVLQDI